MIRFRSQHSTELACVKLADYIIKEMDNIKEIKIPTAIFLDLSKAFDPLDFDFLYFFIFKRTHSKYIQV